MSKNTMSGMFMKAVLLTLLATIVASAGGCGRISAVPQESDSQIPEEPVFFSLTVSRPGASDAQKVTTGATYRVSGSILAREKVSDRIYVIVEQFRPNGRSTVIGREEAELSQDEESMNLWHLFCDMKEPKYPGECIVKVRVGRDQVVDEATFEVFPSDDSEN